MNVSRCDTGARAHTHAHKQPSLVSYPVAMEPVAKAERYVVPVMEVMDEGDGHDHGDDEEEEEGEEEGDRVHEEVDGDGIRNASRMRACRQVRNRIATGAPLSATWVEKGATRNTAQCKQTLSSP